MRYTKGIPCPDPNLTAGLSQRDIDRSYGCLYSDDDRYERELERADRMMDEAKDAELTEPT